MWVSGSDRRGGDGLSEWASSTADAAHPGRDRDLVGLRDLASGLAHEIRNPLQFIKNYAEVVDELEAELLDIIREAAGAAPSTTIDDLSSLHRELSEAAEQIVRHAQRLDAIVESMLATSREAVGDRRLADLNLLVRESADFAYHGRADQHPARLREHLVFELDAGIPPVSVQPLRLSRAVVNVVTNALQATNLGTFDGHEPTVRVMTERRGDGFVIVVEDNGPGVPAEIEDRIFEPFFTDKTGHLHTGLGLTQVWDIVVTDHGGRVSIDSEPGRPTRVTLEIDGGRPEPAAFR
jgi:two-component system, NtrC family, sensor kinase